MSSFLFRAVKLLVFISAFCAENCVGASYVSHGVSGRKMFHSFPHHSERILNDYVRVEGCLWLMV